MERIITQRELRNDNAEIVRALEGGDTFIITRNGVAIGRLTPLARRAFVPTSELQETAAHLSSIDSTQFRADIDAHVDQDPMSRG